MIKKKYQVIGMSCASCQSHVYEAVKKLTGVKDINVNLLTNSMEVTFDEEILKEEKILAAVRNAGYDLALTKNETNKDFNLIKLIVSFSLLFLLMYFSMGHMIGLKAFDSNIVNASVQIVITIIISVIYRKYFISGYKKLFKLKPNMDSLVCLSATASIVYGIYAFIQIILGDNSYYHELYFESASMILTLVSLGKYLESISKKKTTKAINDLVNLAPKLATKIENNKEIVVNPKELKVGDIIIVRSGEAIGADGIIIEGSGSIKEANITGEGIPIYKDIDKEVYASTILLSGVIKVKVTKDGNNSTIEEIIHLVEEASNSKAPISRLADKVSLYFVPIIIFISVLTVIINFTISHNFDIAFNFAVTVLVIACPCSLGLATPVAIMTGIGVGARNGILIRNAIVLEKSASIKNLIFDKTGTITKGEPAVISVNSNNDNFLKISYSLENNSNHPLAKSILNYCNNIELLKVSNYEYIDGLGIKGDIDGITYYLGNKKMVSKYHLATDDATLYTFTDKLILGSFVIEDSLKENSVLALNKIKDLKLNTIMLTGDNKESANKINNLVKMDKVISDVLPKDKGSIVLDIKKTGMTAMVGDGVNDAIALVNSDLSISLGNASSVAINSSDVILERNDLLGVYDFIKLSKKTLSKIKLNLFWAFFYNVIGVILASGIFYYSFGIKLTPMIGALCMSFSSVFVVLNALTINNFKSTRENNKMEKLVINVEGMMCMHCASHVEEACKKSSGVIDAKVSLEDKNVTVTGENLNKDEIIKSIRQAGYKA